MSVMLNGPIAAEAYPKAAPISLSLLWYVGSSQSKEEQDRQEEKIDFIIKKLEPENAKTLLEEWDRKYPKK
jgi:hypothetical protein